MKYEEQKKQEAASGAFAGLIPITFLIVLGVFGYLLIQNEKKEKVKFEPYKSTSFNEVEYLNNWKLNKS